MALAGSSRPPLLTVLPQRPCASQDHTCVDVVQESAVEGRNYPAAAKIRCMPWKFQGTLRIHMRRPLFCFLSLCSASSPFRSDVTPARLINSHLARFQPGLTWTYTVHIMTHVCNDPEGLLFSGPRTSGYSHALPIALQFSHGAAKRCNIWGSLLLLLQTPLPCHQ